MAFGFNLGAFAGGIGQGLEQGEDIRRKRMEMEAQRRMNMAQAAAGQAGIASAGGQPPAAPQGGQMQPQALQGPPPQQAQIPGARPLPPGAPGAMPLPPPAAGAGGPAGANAPPAPQVAPQGPRPVPTPLPPQGGPGGQQPPQAAPAPPGGPTAGPQGAQDGPLSDPAVQQSLKQSQDALKGMYQALITANPNLKKDPQAAFEAVDDMISQLKGVDQSDKNLIAQQNRILQIQWQMAKDAADNAQKGADTQAHVGATERGQDLSHEDRQSSIAASLKKQDLGDATRLQVAQIVQAGADQRTDEVVNQRQAAVDAGLDMKQWQTQVEAQLKEEGFSDAYVARIFGSESANAPAGKAPAAPGRPVPKPLPAAPRRGGQSGMSPADIKASQDNARAALKKHPEARAAILKTLADNGVPTTGL